MVPHRHVIAAALAVLLVAGGWFVANKVGYSYTMSASDTEAGFEEMDDAPLETVDPYANWTRPDGPLRVGLQVGHWHADEAPDEQENLRVNTGASAAGTTEWETNLKIAEETKKLLEVDGIVVDILPVTIPPDYWADVFIAIHADGNTDTSVSGYKTAAPRRDRTGKAQAFVDILEKHYAEATGIIRDPNVTRNMRGYYAFNWRKYEHSIHPMTVAAILETGFITNAKDRRIIVGKPEISAQAISGAVREWLEITKPKMD
ncbi:MAG: N-acetylmuramoyl-L-alanine amidase [Patescibacteria group bacterium]|jgi:N-acetylmuramoyl-L-alanine amidase